jgi:hypothetical protein
MLAWRARQTHRQPLRSHRVSLQPPARVSLPATHHDIDVRPSSRGIRQGLPSHFSLLGQSAVQPRQGNATAGGDWFVSLIVLPLIQCRTVADPTLQGTGNTETTTVLALCHCLWELLHNIRNPQTAVESYQRQASRVGKTLLNDCVLLS